MQGSQLRLLPAIPAMPPTALCPCLVCARRVELLQRVHAANRAAQEEEAQYRRPVGRGARGAPPPEQYPAAVAAAGGVRDINAELITMMMSALEKEHEFL